MDPVRDRLAPVICVLVGAPISAEYLQAYLPSTGDALQMAGGLLILGPLYGGAALLIREVVVRRGLGWTGTLLLAGAFGVAMTGVVDLSLFAEHSAEVDFWDEMRAGTLIAPLGVAAYTAVIWPVGHVLLSIGAPLALLTALVPRHRDRPLLGTRGIWTVGALCLGMAVLINVDSAAQYDVRPTAAQTASVLAVVAALVGTGISRAGRPVTAADAPRPGGSAASGRSSLPALMVAGAVGIVAVDYAPWTWPGTGGLVLLLAGVAVAARRRAARRGWSTADLGGLAAGALVGRALGAFGAPVPPDVDLGLKLAQNAVLLAGTLGVAWWVLRTAEGDGEPPRRRRRTVGRRRLVPSRPHEAADR